MRTAIGIVIILLSVMTAEGNPVIVPLCGIGLGMLVLRKHLTGRSDGQEDYHNM